MLKARLITAFFLITGFLSALFLLPDFHWAFLMLGIIVLGAWEWGQLAKFSRIGQQSFTAAILASGICLLPGVWPGNGPQTVLFWGLLLSALFWLLLVPVWLGKHHQESRKPLLVVAGAMVLLPAWLALVHLRKASPMLVLGLMVAVWLADSAAYFSGKTFGRHKLAPEISPGKTWEGVAGAMLVITVYGVMLSVFMEISLWLVVGLWGITVLSVIGDLFESLLKRQAGLKDSGNLLPGHGGVLDRIDGLTSTLPLAAFYLHFPIYYMALYE